MSGDWSDPSTLNAPKMDDPTYDPDSLGETVVKMVVPAAGAVFAYDSLNNDDKPDASRDVGSKTTESTEKVKSPDGDFTADLTKSKAKSRSGHSYAGNKQLNDKMKADPDFRRKKEKQLGSDVFERTSTSGKGRRNPKDYEWDHNSYDKNKLDLRSTDNHRQKTRAEGQQGGGYNKFYRKKDD